MATSIREVMTPDPVALPGTTPVQQAAAAMRDSDIGAVIVLDQDQKVCGIVTDRDITVRAVAQSADVSGVTLDDICSDNPTTMSPDDSQDEAVRVMREQAIRRLPIVEGGRPVGMVSIGDLAIEKEPESALGEISSAPPQQ